jgi:FAN1, HTH domain/VRR-NUC domain/Fanconi anemia-associated nuclease SAP domain
MAVFMYSISMETPETSHFHQETRGRDARVEEEAARSGLSLLEPFYYLKNFELVLGMIESRYSDLLLVEESQFIAEFPRLPMVSRALLVRMVMRRGDLFRASKLNYSEIGETRAAAEPLITLKWVSDRPALKLAQFARLITKTELIQCLKLPPRYVRWCKPDLVVMLAGQFAEAKSFQDWCGDQDFAYGLLVARLCERFRLMFFGNDRQTWSEFVTADLGIFRYEKVERSLYSRPFQTRVHIEVFKRIQECRELLREGMPLDEFGALVPEVIEDGEWLEERRQKLLFLIAREYERAGENETALERYLACSYRGARSRAIRLKAKAQDWGGARTLCVFAKANPESEAELQHVRRVLPRVHRKLKIECAAEHSALVTPEFEVILEGTAGTGAVEYRVRDHLARDLPDPSTVRYVENGLITALFGLLCWPAIFAPVRGAFFHDFHHGPVDLESGHFYRRRRSEFDECFAHLDSGGYREVIWRVFKEKWGIQSPFVRWHHLDKTLLLLSLDCFPPEHLRLWFEWILRDVKENRAGFPDLVQFYPEQRKYRLIEVKGPGDRVQDNQKRLLEYCVSHGMPVSVCYVRWRVQDPA